MSLIIEVTEDDLFNGVIEDGENCPIALAMKRRGFRDVHVGPHVISFTRGRIFKKFEIRLVPEEARQLILDFDNCRSVKPIKFDLDRYPNAFESS